MDGHLSSETNPEAHRTIDDLITPRWRQSDNRLRVRAPRAIIQRVQVTAPRTRTEIIVGNERGKEDDSPDKDGIRQDTLPRSRHRGKPPVLALHQTDQRGSPGTG